MGTDSNISWTDHTLNLVRGCEEEPLTSVDLADSGCLNCYARTMATRNPKTLGVWGAEGTRVLASETIFAMPAKWNAVAKERGVKAKVFAYSLGDVFERPARQDLLDVCETARSRFWPIIEKCDWLDFQLLTKRPQNIMDMVPKHWRDGFPENVWVGTSCENQTAAEKRVPLLKQVPASVRWLSVEPMIGPINLDLGRCDTHNREHVVIAPEYGEVCNECAADGWSGELSYNHWLDPCASIDQAGINWIVCGGESGGKRRPFDVQWAIDLQRQCEQAGVAFFMKQDSAFKPGQQGRLPDWLWNTKGFPRHA